MERGKEMKTQEELKGNQDMRTHSETYSRGGS